MPRPARDKPNFTPWWSSPIPPARDSMWATPGSIPPWTWWPGKRRMDGYNVLPHGLDAFGLPTRELCHQEPHSPRQGDPDNIANFTKQLKMLGYSL